MTVSFVPAPRSIRWLDRREADLDEIVGGSGQRRQGTRPRAEEKPIVGEVDRIRRTSRGEQDVGVVELQDLDVDEGVGAVAARHGVGDRRLAAAVGRDGVLGPAAGEDRDVAAGAAVDGVVAAAADEGVAVAVADQRVAEGRAGDAVDAAGDGVGAGHGDVSRRGAVGGAERQVDRDRGRGIGVDDAGVAVAGDDVVAAEAFELVEVAVVADIEGAGQAVAGRVVMVGEVGALDAFDRTQRVGADRGVAGRGAGRHVDGDAAGGEEDVVVARDVEAAAAVDVVVAGETGEGVVGGRRPAACRRTSRPGPR